MQKTQLPLAFCYPKEYFNIQDTLECGQIFRYKRLSDSAYGVYSTDKYAELRYNGDVVETYTFDGDYFYRFFDLDTDYGAKAARISSISPLMAQAVGFGKGIRILNQDLTEMIFSFIISANNNIKRIQLIIERICNALGDETPYGKAFPSLQAMAQADIKVFTASGAGYRDKYLHSTANKLLTYDLSSLDGMSSADARKELLAFMGIGPKVADCILLFGLKRGDVFPVDTWLKKVYHSYFEQGHKDSEISGFFCNLFGDDAGLCQQYLFYFQRKYRQSDANNVK
ncbi:MAG: hypothetical protein NC099_04900 [Corallococcus sp.]|nr:hypothetical protein [Corallococcus sp.]